MGAFLFCRMARNTLFLSVVVLLLIRCLPNVAEEALAAFRKLVGRNLCQPSAKYWVAFSRSRFSSLFFIRNPRSNNERDSEDCLSAKGCGEELSPYCGGFVAAAFVSQSGIPI